MIQRLRAIIAMLLMIFVLGMLENLIGTPASDASMLQNAASGGILLLHVLTGIGILVTAAQIMRHQETMPKLAQTRASQAFAGAGTAFLAGIATLATPSPWQEVFSFVMALGFISSLTLYGYVLVIVSQGKYSSSKNKK